ncbi:MAG: hypothetical protein F6K42_34565 [Leptolyngbya sp. SIO1D8]|nr:hypothetical protein [Leptolyngbya sp. SIO1D8]
MAHITSSRQSLKEVFPVLDTSIKSNSQSSSLNELLASESNQQYFQILKVDYNKVNPTNIKTTLITKTKDESKSSDFPVIIYDAISQSWKNAGTIGEKLPTAGAIPDQEFSNLLGNGNKNLGLAEYSTVRFLLQTRRVSQLVARTWLSPRQFDNEWERHNIELTRDLILSSNLEPDYYEPQGVLDDIRSQSPKTDYIIEPGMLNFDGIRLSLLLAGQAYRWVEKGTYNNDIEGYLQICDSILSTYEIVYEYAWRVSWDTFYASRVDVAQPGLKPRPPYYEVTLAYPPKPDTSEGSPLTEEKIKRWGFASEKQGDFPFYPKRNESFEPSSPIHRSI